MLLLIMMMRIRLYANAIGVVFTCVLSEVFSLCRARACVSSSGQQLGQSESCSDTTFSLVFV